MTNYRKITKQGSEERGDSLDRSREGPQNKKNKNQLRSQRSKQVKSEAAKRKRNMCLIMSRDWILPHTDTQDRFPSFLPHLTAGGSPFKGLSFPQPLPPLLLTPLSLPPLPLTSLPLPALPLPPPPLPPLPLPQLPPLTLPPFTLLLPILFCHSLFLFLFLFLFPSSSSTSAKR